MKKLSILISVAGVLCAPALQAALQVTLTQNTALYSYGNGGEFRASGSVIAGVNPTLWGYSPATAQGGVGAYFQTFCIETSEYFSPGVAYNISLNSRAMYGGQFPNGDPISIGTAWLYSQFAAGTLVGLDALNNPVAYNYAYGPGRTLSAGALQQAIWWLEGEAVDPGNTDAFRNAVIAQFGSAAAAEVDANGAYGVLVLNLWDKNTGAVAQDQLILVPEPTTVLAGLLLLLPLGASTIRILRKNHSS